MEKNNLSDNELHNRAMSGDSRSKEQLIRRYLPLANWHVRHFVANDSQYDDFRQEALLGLVRAIDTFKPQVKVQFSTYATTCITNALITHKRKLQRTQEFVVSEGGDEDFFENVVDSTQPNFLESLYASELRETLAQKLSSLELQSLFYHAEGYSYKEIASLLEVSPKQVANALSRAHNKLKKS